ncbi:MAG: hypothetical protein GY821_10625 [Gammaproteobacteria bacterium]|nr:hypothetical protein [Gammaproteobacteria bacterium]MCP4474996.1 hypothetical protein [Gammaproteobacteria bacterium]
MGKDFLRAIFLLLLILPLSAGATWQIADPSRGAALPPHTAVTGYPGRYHSRVVIYVRRGYLYSNIRRTAHEYGWGLIWYPRHHYAVFTPAAFSGDTFINTMSRLLSHYPLVVTYRVDRQNHTKTMIVRPIRHHH